jgi:hypothetical protein
MFIYCQYDKSGMSGAPEGTATKSVDKYLPRIFANWNDLATKSEIVPQAGPAAPAVRETSGAVPLVGPSMIVDRKRLEEDFVSREITRVREEFLKEATALHSRRLAELEERMRNDYESELVQKDGEITRSRRVINIQNAILSKIYERDRDALLKILIEADISEEDLMALAGNS